MNTTEKVVAQQQPPPQCPEGCCTGTEILCISIPCPVTIVLLGITLTLNLPCLSLSSPNPLTGAQTDQLLGALRGVLGGLSAGLPGAGGTSA